MVLGTATAAHTNLHAEYAPHMTTLTSSDDVTCHHHSCPCPAFVLQAQTHLTAAEMAGRDAASLLSSLATLKHTPSEPWLHSCLQLLYFRLPELDPEGLASVSISLAKLNVMVGNGQWLDNYISLTVSRLSSMSVETQVNLLSALAVFGADLPKAWVAAFQLMCVQQAEAGKMTAAQLEQVSSRLRSAIVRAC